MFSLLAAIALLFSVFSVAHAQAARQSLTSSNEG